MSELLPCPECGAYKYHNTSCTECNPDPMTPKPNPTAAVMKAVKEYDLSKLPALIEAIAQLKDGIEEREYLSHKNLTPIWNNDLDAVFAAADAMEVK